MHRVETRDLEVIKTQLVWAEDIPIRSNVGRGRVGGRQGPKKEENRKNGKRPEKSN